MKKFFALLLAAVLCISLAGCGAKDKAPDPADYDFVINTQLIAEHTETYLNSESYLNAVANYETWMNSKNGGALLGKAMEYHLEDFDGFSIHAILLQLRTDVAYGEGVISDTALVCIDLTNGEVTDNLSPEFDEYSNTFNGTFESNAQLRVIMMNVLFSNDLDTPVFFHDKEIKKALTEDEIATVNETLGLSYKGYESSEAADEGVDEETGNPIISTDPQERIQKVTEMASAFKDTPLYQEIAVDPSTIHVGAAMEYKNDDFSGFPVHILMAYVDRIDTEQNPFFIGTLLMDLNTGTTYTYTDFDFNQLANFNSFTSVEDAYPHCIMAYEGVLLRFEPQLWSSTGETMLQLTEEELSRINETLGSAAAADSAERDALRQEAAKNLTKQQKLFFDAAVDFSSTPRYKEAAKNPASISLASAAEFSFVHPDNGFELNVLLLQAEGIDTDMYGFSSGIFLKDRNTGSGYTDTFMDLSSWTWDWEDYSDVNNVYAACILVYESAVTNNENHLFMDHDNDKLTKLSKADLDAINAALNP